MIYDIWVYFSQDQAPTALVREVVEMFGLPWFEVNERCWKVDASTSVWLDLAPNMGSCGPPDARWRLTVSTSTGRSPAAWAVQRTMPYVLLALGEGCSFHDCLRHAEGLIYDPALYLASMIGTQEDLPEVSRTRLTSAGLLGGGPDAEVMAAFSGDPAFLFHHAMDLKKAGDLVAARQWRLRAAEAGDSPAMIDMAFELEEGGDVAAALSWLERAAAGGDASAMCIRALLAEIHELGDARTWYERAAAAGDPDAACWLASNRTNGQP